MIRKVQARWGMLLGRGLTMAAAGMRAGNPVPRNRRRPSRSGGRADGLSLCLEPLEPRQMLAGDVVISEFMASNDNGLRDEDHNRPDWIEILNTSGSDVNLDGWFLTDDADDLDKWQLPNVTLGAGQRKVVFASAKNRTESDGPLHTNFRLGVDGDYLALVEPDGLTVAFDFGPQYPPQQPDISFGLAQAVSELTLHTTGDSARLLVPRDDSLGPTWSEVGFDDASWLTVPTGVGYGSRFGDAIETNLEAEVRGVNPSVYLRLPFAFDNPGEVFSLTLTIQYNDGFVAFLNGVEVASRNAPSELTWNSLATDRRQVLPSLVAEQLDLSPFLAELRSGDNVLAIQGLNSDASSSRFLIAPRLTAGLADELQLDRRSFFTSPSPGGANGLGTTTALVDVTHTPNVPRETDNLAVTASVISTAGDVGNVTLHYRVMFEPETSLPMFDDGAHGDQAAGDGIYAAAIPASIASPAQMIRYRITAGETPQNSVRAPDFVDSLTTEQYFGTVVEDSSIQSGLPVIHLFLEDPAAADGDEGTHGSLFHDGEFYDNIEIDVTGRTIGRTGPKKSHDIFFPRDHWFTMEYEGRQLRMDDFDIMTDYWNRAKVRIPLGYETFRNIGTPAHLSFPVRVQRNGEFYGTYSFVDGGNERFLQRAGVDPRGALYKMNLDFLPQENVFKKQTRNFEDNSDVEALFAGLNLSGTARTQFLADNVNVPAVVNYLVGLVVMAHGDCCGKNLYVYRDTEGTGLWEALPWDVDSAFGRGGVRSEPIFPQSAGVFAGTNNLLFSALLADMPGFRDMYLRRLRTLLDEFLQPPGTPAEELKFERRIDEMVEQMMPDAPLDFDKWGSWKTDPATDVTTFGKEGIATWLDHVDILKNEYFPARREFIYRSLRQANGGQELEPQIGAPEIRFGQVEFNPASGNQDEEFIELTNPNDVAVDISGWKLAGGVQHTFHPGTVIPAGSILYVSPNVNAFRARATGPSGGQGLFVQGNYAGHISNHGTSIQLMAGDTTIVGEITTVASPSPEQQFLRISEVMYHPQDPPTGSRFEDDDYEFIELVNISTTETLNLRDIVLTAGVQFTFPEMSLAPGERVVIARNESALAERYGVGISVAGQYGGTADDFKLSNQGELVRLEIAAGDLIQQFTYDDQWIPSTDGGGHSLTVVNTNVDVGRLDLPESWRASLGLGGTPGSADDLPPLPGDSNGDGVFDQRDIVLVLQAAKYLTGQPASFAEGDWNGDGVFDQRDLVAALSKRDTNRNVLAGKP